MSISQPSGVSREVVLAPHFDRGTSAIQGHCTRLPQHRLYETQYHLGAVQEALNATSYIRVRESNPIMLESGDALGFDQADC